MASTLVILASIGFIIFVILASGYNLEGIANLVASLTGEVTGNCKSFYCSDYEFICCGERKSESGTWNLNDVTKYWQCPLSTTRCAITKSVQTGIGENCYVGKNNCKSGVLGIFSCSDGVSINSLTDTNLQAGQYIYGLCRQITYNDYRLNLAWCGTGACDAGTTGRSVLGASGCSFVTNNDIYGPSGNLVKPAVEGQDFQITVPQGQCYLSQSGRHACGDTCESCSSDSDCLTGHTLNYGGKGAECATGQLQVYGCKKYGTQPNDNDLTVLPWESKTVTYNFGSRCDVIQTMPIQCCPSSDSCGLNAVCDKATFTCKSSGTVGCTADWQCGTAQGCTYEGSNKVIKGKACQSGKCVDTTLKTVNCCYDTDCPSGWHCDSTYTCKQSVIESLPCPWDCCIALAGFKDKPCALGLLCCGDHTCKADCKSLPSQQICNYNGICEQTLGENKANCPDCKFDILEWLKIFLGGLIVSGIICILLVYVLPIFVPMLNIFNKFKTPRNLLMLWLFLAIVLTALFALPMGQIASMVI